MDEPLSNPRRQAAHRHTRAQNSFDLQAPARPNHPLRQPHDGRLEAMRWGHRIAVLNAGTAPTARTPMQLYKWPVESVFVAHVHRQPPMNLLPGAGGVVRPGAAWAPGAFLVEGPAARPLIHYTSGALRRGITGGLRPENLKNRPRCQPATSKPRSAHVEALGNEALISCPPAGWWTPGAGASANPSSR